MESKMIFRMDAVWGARLAGAVDKPEATDHRRPLNLLEDGARAMSELTKKHVLSLEKRTQSVGIPNAFGGNMLETLSVTGLVGE